MDAMDSNFWMKACNFSYVQPVNNAILASDVSSWFAVVSFALAAFFSSTWLFRWLRLKSRRKDLMKHIWRHLGLFCGLVLAGSISGVISWSANMPSLALYYQARDPMKASIRTQQRTVLLTLYAQASWVAVFLVAQGLETLCLTLAKILVIGRLIKHLQSAKHLTLKVPFLKIFNTIVAAVLICGVTGLSASIAGSYYKIEAGRLAKQAADACNVSGAFTTAAIAIARNSGAMNKVADQVIAVQNACEMSAMLIIIASYIVVIPNCISILRRTKQFLINARQKYDGIAMKMAHHHMSSSAEAANVKAQEMVSLTIQAADDQHHRFIFFCALILLTFLPRAVYSVIQAIGNTSTVLNTNCGVCQNCQSVYLLINIWLRYTPQFRAITVTISSPLPLSACLWFMMSARQRLLLATVGESLKDEHGAMDKAAEFARQGLHIELPLDAASLTSNNSGNSGVR